MAGFLVKTTEPPSELLKCAARHLSDVEDRLRSLARSCGGETMDIALHLIEAGGKRLRPTLVLCTALAVKGCEAVTDRVINAAVTVEYLHLGTLYHDDVLDSASVRRGRSSANCLWGNHAAIFGGDLLLAQACAVASGLGLDEVVRISETLSALCDGQLAETNARFDKTRGIDQYCASIRGKTAALLATSCWMGAFEAGAASDTRQALERFGVELGIAFQMIDDLLDLFADAAVIGKPCGNDLRQGVFTFPVLEALRRDHSLAELMVEGIDDEGVAKVRERVRAVGADKLGLDFALGHLRTAMGHVSLCQLTEEGKNLFAVIAGAVLKPLETAGFLSRSPSFGIDRATCT